jgi:hypothetical protein
MYPAALTVFSVPLSHVFPQNYHTIITDIKKTLTLMGGLPGISIASLAYSERYADEQKLIKVLAGNYF